MKERSQEWGIFYPIDVQRLTDKTLFDRPLLDCLRGCEYVRPETEHTWYLSACAVDEQHPWVEYLRDAGALGETPYRIACGNKGTRNNGDHTKSNT